jgi:hypothetical protein
MFSRRLVRFYSMYFQNVALQLFSPKFIELGKESLDVFENCKYVLVKNRVSLVSGEGRDLAVPKI